MNKYIILGILIVLIAVPVSAQACWGGDCYEWEEWECWDCTPPPPPPPIYVECFDAFDCGTDGYTGSLFCQGNSVYQNYTTYRCNNPGTASSYCSDYTSARVKTMCTTNQTCSNGTCSDVACSRDSQCGFDAYTGSPFCQNGDVYQNFVDYTCNSPGTASSYCSNTTTAQLKTDCSGNQSCSNGYCATVACSNDSQCGTGGGYTGSPFCQNGDVYQNYTTYRCNNPGTATSYCSNSTETQLRTDCASNQTCSNGSCQSQTCTSNSYQRCSGNYLYWYDSCGNQQNSQYCPNGCSGSACLNQTCTQNYQQRCYGSNLYWYDSCGNIGSLIQYCPNGCSGNTCLNPVTANLTVSKTVKNLTTGSSFATSVYASPADMLIFMITLQSSGNNVQNVIVRDTLPSNLTYSNQLIVARSGSASSNYSGDIVSGVNLGTIPSGQTVTITYQAQLASAQSFTFGTTTLVDPTSTTSSAGSPSASASVVVTRSGVLGASTISTGLTNNFWLDSFFLPLLITLIVIGMWRSGIFFGVEKWFENKNKAYKGHKAEKELAKRIEQLKR